MTERIREFNAFLRDHVNLNQTRVSTLQARVSSLDTFLSEDSSISQLVADDIIPQGSFAHKTIIRPLTGNDFDADVLLPMEEQEDWQPKKYTIELQKALEASSRYRGKTTLGKRCVTINYADDFHIDVVPFVTRADGDTYITHRINNEWIHQDPVALTEWIEESSRTTHGHLIRVIRLIKYLRDRSSLNVASVVLTAMLTERVHSFAGVDDYQNVSTTLVSLVEDLNEHIGSCATAPWVDDRIGQNLADRLSHTGFLNLKSQVKTWANKMRAALDAPANESVEKWRQIFGDKFGAATTSEVALSASADSVETFKYRLVPGEQDIERDHHIPVRISSQHRFRLVGRMSATRKRAGRFRPLSGGGDHVPIGRSLTFSIEDCTVEQPYDIYWKVRNSGVEAVKRNSLRGEIIKGGPVKTETSNFAGNHWVQAWIVKNGVAIATDIQEVTIMPR
ncbi:hypothetical protein AUR04nite_09800 [Glutamicibacter uratoxydans]|uniref:Adenylyl/Guanylyl and SMODS C-terminal sensor domain-containing protein n=1 Tax=Glutamicibacter uratoxydans TaxID=43667 RepID=A0A4Y4DQ01_GLUUR|nr:nucleotidyltransferase [Glutamicibacter uratoxydans]GED05448.1 hypothetical protein AUR04nite_09800 [Glutamicibacter uratoxydans]